MGDTESRAAGETGLQGSGGVIRTFSTFKERTHTTRWVLWLRYLTGVGVGPLTGRTGDGDCWRPPVALDRKEGGDLEVGFGGTLGGVL